MWLFSVVLRVMLTKHFACTTNKLSERHTDIDMSVIHQ
jgi:hypothetical protein